MLGTAVWATKQYVEKWMHLTSKTSRTIPESIEGFKDGVVVGIGTPPEAARAER